MSVSRALADAIQHVHYKRSHYFLNARFIFAIFFVIECSVSVALVFYYKGMLEKVTVGCKEISNSRIFQYRKDPFSTPELFSFARDKRQELWGRQCERTQLNAAHAQLLEKIETDCLI